MSSRYQPTGIYDAVLMDVLLKSDSDPAAVMAMSAQQRLDAVRTAAEDGRLDTRTMAMLARIGIIEPSGGEEAAR